MARGSRPAASKADIHPFRTLRDTAATGVPPLGPAVANAVVRAGGPAVLRLPFARSGLVGATILGLGRALGETMAITMVIGNRAEISASLFAPSYTMASVIANEFTEATGQLYLSALAEVGLRLFVVTVLLNIVARLLVWRVGRLPEGGRL